MIFEYLPAYEKDFKRLAKKYRTLERDMEVVKKVLHVRPDALPPFSYRISGLGISSCVIKMKRIASDSFKGKGNNSGFRLIYVYSKEPNKIVFIELYHKSEKEVEDRQRIILNFI